MQQPPASPRRRLLLGLGLAIVLAGAVLFVLQRRARSDGLPRYTYEVVATHPHDSDAYTQGLFVHEGEFFESTGRLGRSTVRRVDIETGEVLQSASLPFQFFGEGLAAVEDRLYQLTWQAGEVRVYDLATLDFLRKYTYEGEGWGLAFDGERLVMSDGTAYLRFFDPADFSPLGRLEVRVEGEPLGYLNELEFVEGELFANVWKESWIARIDPATGEVTGWIDIAGIYPWERLPDPDSVPNGIAYDAKADRLFVTGKLWPTVFEIELARAD